MGSFFSLIIYANYFYYLGNVKVVSLASRKNIIYYLIGFSYIIIFFIQRLVIGSNTISNIVFLSGILLFVFFFAKPFDQYISQQLILNRTQLRWIAQKDATWLFVMGHLPFILFFGLVALFIFLG